MRGFGVLFRREFALAWGRGGGPLLALAFYACVVTLLPLAAGRAPERLASLAPGIAWLALALAALLSLERLFERDFEDGALDLLALGPAPLEAVAAAKCLAHWLAAGAPLALAAPVAAVILGASPAIMPLLFVCALAGGLAFSFLGGLGAALSLGSKRGGLLVAVIVLPLYAPPVIFGAGALDALTGGLPWTGGLLFLLAYSAAAVALSPLAMAAACRNALD
ncbi:heme exporter protein CcmB [Caulobacter flavus]|uniref:Heme exporter protein B n=1 Tax=Caulobacter flavus TaxID=1679497 RepID=A0A2N5CMJ2_9CAUL|nr:heme exporter protein CcmB [Caulobacter flavus]AYV45729.1 heme exporter protein CcmB [Caulobacter flavus]PLR07230.1 heme exporter protein CcmB [Caulobacter flavus]